MEGVLVVYLGSVKFDLFRFEHRRTREQNDAIVGVMDPTSEDSAS